jgi:surface protein
MAAFLWRAEGSPPQPRDDPADFVAWFDTTRETNRTVTLPLRGTVDVTIDWGDGTTPQQATGSGNVTHTYATNGYYKVTITGTLARYGVRCAKAPNVDKLIAVSSFGDVGITELEWAFANAGNLGKVPRLLPDGVIALEGAFGDPSLLSPEEIDLCSEPDAPVATQPLQPSAESASVFGDDPNWATLDITQWDTSDMTDMSWLFAGQEDFNQDISGWDTSNVTNMNHMFLEATSFNQPLNGWDVSNVTEMQAMFMGATAFQQDLDSWDVRSVEYADSMFGYTSFDGDLSGWEFESLRTGQYMFTSRSADIVGWSFTQGTDLRGMFSSNGGPNDYSNITGRLIDWDVSGVVNMSRMFWQSTFNHDISDWDVSNVTDMKDMFHEAINFNQDLSRWDVRKVEFDPTEPSGFENCRGWNFFGTSRGVTWTKPKPQFTCAPPFYREGRAGMTEDEGSSVDQLFITADQRTWFGISNRNQEGDYTIYRFDLTNWNPDAKRQLVTTTQVVTAAALDPSEQFGYIALANPVDDCPSCVTERAARLLKIDLRSLSVVQDIPLAAAAMRIVIPLSEKYAYVGVISSGVGRIDRIDLRTALPAGSLSLAGLSGQPTGFAGAVASPTGSNVYFTVMVSVFFRDTVQIDTATFTQVGQTIPITQVPVFSPDGSRLFGVSPEKEILEVDAATRTVVRSVPIEMGNPAAAVVHLEPTAQFAYVRSINSSNVSVLSRVRLTDFVIDNQTEFPSARTPIISGSRFSTWVMHVAGDSLVGPGSSGPGRFFLPSY